MVPVVISEVRGLVANPLVGPDAVPEAPALEEEAGPMAAPAEENSEVPLKWLTRETQDKILRTIAECPN